MEFDPYVPAGLYWLLIWYNDVVRECIPDTEVTL